MSKKKPKSVHDEKLSLTPTLSPRRGRPSRYQVEYEQLGYNYCLLGATDGEMAEFFGVSEQTLNAWKKAHPEFLESLKRGKAAADATVAERLYQRACGYSHPAVKFFQHEGVVTQQEYIEHYPPDTGACVFFLKNRQPAKWRDKPEVSVVVNNSVDISRPPEEWGEAEIVAELQRRKALPQKIKE
jgi:hypothetical protein